MNITQAERASIFHPPYGEFDKSRSWLERGMWPCHWISPVEDYGLPSVVAYRRIFKMQEAQTIRIHVAADERYDLYLDGALIGRGSERGAPHLWFFDTYDLGLQAGTHVLVARVWSLGPVAPRSQMTLRPGFLLSPQENTHFPLLGTGIAGWECKVLRGNSFSPPFEHPYYSIGHNVTVDASLIDPGWQTGDGSRWMPVRKRHPGSDAFERTRVGGEHLLMPACLPPARYAHWASGVVRHAWQSHGQIPGPSTAPTVSEQTHQPALAQEWEHLWKAGHAFTVPPGTTTRILLDLQDYVCAYGQVVVSGGRAARIQIHWAESLFCDVSEPADPDDLLGAKEKPKGNRDEISGKVFCGVGETFLPDGRSECEFDGPFWRAGRYVLVTISTADEPLEVRRFTLQETRYPLEIAGALACDDPRMARLFDKAVRTFSVSCHDAWVDPYYEQMMWAGDGLQNMLFNSVVSGDSRLAAKWLRLLWASRLPSGFTCARYPARDNLLIAPYSLYWIQGLKEYAWWRSDPALVRQLLPAAREVLMVFEQFMDADGLIGRLPGWNFVDWAAGWFAGIPPGADSGASSILNWHYVLALVCMAELEEASGEPELAARHRRMAARSARASIRAFWNEERGLFADDLSHNHFSEHGQCFAILSDLLEVGMAARATDSLLTAPDLTRTTFGFTHHLFETFGKIGRVDRLFERLQPWFDLEGLGMVTLPEGPEPSRSDCHSWSTHPVFHLMATVLGIRPDGPGFRQAIIRPQPGPLMNMEATLPHPSGLVKARLARYTDRVCGEIHLPPGVPGRIISGGEEIAFCGSTSFDLPCSMVRPNPDRGCR